jgi:hypothetical protein
MAMYIVRDLYPDPSRCVPSRSGMEATSMPRPDKPSLSARSRGLLLNVPRPRCRCGWITVCGLPLHSMTRSCAPKTRSVGSEGSVSLPGL